MRSARTTRSRRRISRTAGPSAINPLLFFDICGVALVVLGLATGVALFAQTSSGIFGAYVAAGLHVTVGVGAYIIPLLLILLGVTFIAGPLRIIPRNIGIGSVILFLTIVAWASLRVLTGVHGAATGGYLGDGLACVLRKAAGDLISYFVLTGLGIVGLIIVVDAPLSSLIERTRDMWLSWREAATARRAMAEAARPKDRAAKVKIAPVEKEAVEQSRRRSLAHIFSRGADVAEKSSEDLQLTGPTFSHAKKEGGNGDSDEGLDLGDEKEFQLPPTSLLNEPPPPPQRVESELRENIEIIERTLSEFKVEASVVEIAHGPTVARYEIRLAPGIKVNKIVTLADNLAMQLAAIAVRVEAPIPGKSAIGVEVPNRERGTVGLREIVESKAFRESGSKLTFALGKDVAGKPVVADLGRMPHMLIGGATNAGKSVGLNALISSLLFRATPDEMKFVLIDPKRVELSMFDGIPHLACPVVKDVKQAAGIFRAVVQEMEHRYKLFSRAVVRNIDSYNERNGEGEKMPYIVLVVDELCDLMVQAAAEVEGSITRLAQLARATGIHLVIATQRPSVDVITGIIKANIPSRVAFACSSHHDSRTILDHKGAERLLGSGDMLFLPIDAQKPMRIQGSYISEQEIERVCDFLKAQRKPVFTIQPAVIGEGGPGDIEGGEAFADEFYEPSVRLIVNTGYCSTSMLQRKFKIGYTRAARIVDFMEQQGIVGGLEGAGTKGRQVFVSKADLEQMMGGRLGFAPDEDEEDVPPSEIVYPDEEEER